MPSDDCEFLVTSAVTYLLVSIAVLLWAFN